MRRRQLGASLVTGLAIAASVALAPAQAKPGYSVFPGFRQSEFSLKGTHGYEVTVTHFGRRVALHASDGDSAAIYLVPARKPSGDGTIKATFPGVGRVSVRFDPSGQPRRSPPFFAPECRGRGEVRQRGTFRGTIRFRGEEGFTQVTVGKASGFVHLSHREVCKGGPGGNSESLEEGYSLTSYARSQGRLIVFRASRMSFEGLFDDYTTHSAQIMERRRGMMIARVATALDASPRTFAVSGPPARPDSASISPPAPFRGTADFHGTVGGQADWEGTLAIDLPGASDLELAGPSFSSQLCLKRRCTGDPIPGSSAERPQLLAQGSGSQSQLFGDARLSWSR